MMRRRTFLGSMVALSLPALARGQAPADTVFRAAAEAAAKAIDPLEDHQTNAEYRRDLVRAVVRRALESSTS